MLAQVDLRRGLLRIWIVLTVLWLAAVAGFAWLEVSDATGGRWQYGLEMKSDLKPSGRNDPAKSFDEQFEMPSKAKRPPSFSKVEHRYLQGFDDYVREGRMSLLEYPDGSSLYLNVAFAKPEQELVSKWFWDRRWGRLWTALSYRSWLVPTAIVPPLLLLVAGLTVGWIVKGFRRG